MGHDRRLVERSPSRWPWVVAAVVVVGAGSTMLRDDGGREPAAPERPPADLPSDVQSAGDAQWVTPVEGVVAAAPAVVGAVVVVGAEDGSLLGIERDTGARLWRVDGPATEHPRPVPVGSLAVVAGEAEVQAFRAVNGATAWQVDLPSPAVGTPVAVGTRVLVLTESGEVLSIDGSRGEVRWRAETRAPAAGALGADGRIVAVPGGDGRLRGLRIESGEIAYTGDVGEAVGVGVSRGLAFVSTADGDLVALDDDGDERWRVAVDDGTSAPPVIVGDAVVVAGGDGAVRAFDRLDGDALWVRTAGEPVTAPLLQRREVVLVTTPGGWLHRLDAATGRLAGSARAGRGAVAALNPGAGPNVFTVDASGAVTGLRLRS